MIICCQTPQHSLFWRRINEISQCTVKQRWVCTAFLRCNLCRKMWKWDLKPLSLCHDVIAFQSGALTVKREGSPEDIMDNFCISQRRYHSYVIFRISGFIEYSMPVNFSIWNFLQTPSFPNEMSEHRVYHLNLTFADN